MARPTATPKDADAASPPSGLAPHPDPQLRCAGCAWRYDGGRGRPVARCRQSVAPGTGHGRRLPPGAPACVRYEPAFDATTCRACGACCREGFHLVAVGQRDPVRRRHPELVVRDGFGYHIPRPQGRCVALTGAGSADAPYTCRIYPERPRNCAEFEAGGEACLIARRRVGLST